MKTWEESKDEIQRITPDKELSRSIQKMIEIRLKALKLKNNKEFASLIVEDYYEIIKEAITALMAIDGYKTLSHEILIGYLKKFHPQFSESEIELADQLRILRNKIAYKGFFVNPDFIKRNESKIRSLTTKLLNVLRSELL